MTLILSTIEATPTVASSAVVDPFEAVVETVIEARMPPAVPGRTPRGRLRPGLVSAGAAVIPSVYIGLPLALILRQYQVAPAAALCAVLVLLMSAALLIGKTVARTMKLSRAELARTSQLGGTPPLTSLAPVRRAGLAARQLPSWVSMSVRG